MVVVELNDKRLPGRFWDKVSLETSSGCWCWTAAVNRDGYGQFRWNGKLYRAHRLTYQTLIGPIPSSLVSDHLCRVRSCVNPSHVELVTNRENILRGDVYNKTHCRSGHKYDEGNTGKRLNPNGYWRRWCRKCRKEYNRKYYLEKVRGLSISRDGAKKQ